MHSDLCVEKLTAHFQETLSFFYHKIRQKPKLVILRIGENPASAIYVGRKKECATRLGFSVQESHFSDSVSTEELEAFITQCNLDETVNGILLQLPLPKHLPVLPLLAHIHPDKDVDGLHPLNLGKLLVGDQTGFIPCTPWGCLALLKYYTIPLKGADVLIVGRSRLVGKPLASLLTNEDATVTLAHSQTQNLETYIARANIICLAVGKPRFLQASVFHKHHIVLDIGINKNAHGLEGDVPFKDVLPHVKGITPVPKGIGPMTIMGLLHNTLKASFKQHGLDDKAILPPSFW